MQSVIELISSENPNVYLFKITREASFNYENVKEDVYTVVMDGEYILSCECMFGVLGHEEMRHMRTLLSKFI